MDSLMAINLNMEREVQTKDFVLVGVVAAAAAVTVIAKYGADELVAALKARKVKKLASVEDLPVIFPEP